MAAVMTTDKPTGQRTRRPVEVPPEVMARAIATSSEVPKAIKTLRRAGISVADIARASGVDRWTIWSWSRGINVPRTPVTAFLLIEWARSVTAMAEYKDLLVRLQKGANNADD